MKLDRLVEHALLREPLDRVRPVLLAAVKKSECRPNRSGNIRFKLEMPTHLLYDSDVFQAASALHEDLMRLEDVRHFLRLMPTTKKFAELKMSEQRWVDYHFSYHMILLSSVLDLSLLLTNVVFRLGNPERLCTLDNIKNNKYVANTAVRKAIDNLERMVKPHKEKRNLFVHRGKRPDPSQASGSDSYDMLTFIGSTNSLAAKVSEPFADPKFINRAFRSEIGLLISALEKDTLEVTKAVGPLFDSLLPFYKGVIEANGKPRGAGSKED